MGEHLKFGALNDLFGFHLRQAYTPFGQAYREAAAIFKLKPSQFTVLVLVKHNPGRRQSELAEALNIKRSNFVPIIDALEARGLLTRGKSPDDRRSYSIEATPKGWNPKGEFTISPQTKQRNPKGKVWTHPVISNGKMYLRDQELIFCYDISS